MEQYLFELVNAAETLKASLLEIFVEDFLDEYPEAEVTLCDIDGENAIGYLTATCNGETLYHYGDAAGAWNLTLKDIRYIAPEIRCFFERTLH
jgi:L-ascorbate metabolism protein UlaG (beta-lactamase superfamily)